MKQGVGIALLAALAACAQVGPPPGGPVDKEPPELAAVSPGSLATQVAPDAPLQLQFNEKVDRRNFERSVALIPDVPLRKAKVDGASVTLRPTTAWPADTVVVWTLLPTLKDRHGVGLGRTVTGAFTTAAAFPPGRIEGQVRAEDEEADLTEVVVHLSLAAADSGSRKRPLWRRASADGQGRFSLQWLEIPSGPFHLAAWIDANHDDRRDEREPVAEVDSLFLAAGDSMLSVGTLQLVDLEAPVEVWACWPAAIEDSLARIVYYEALQDPEQSTATAVVDSTGCATRALVPGTYRVGAWIDADGDGRFGPDSLGVSEPFLRSVEWEIEPASPDTVIWPDVTLERLPWASVDTLQPPPLPADLHPKER